MQHLTTSVFDDDSYRLTALLDTKGAVTLRDVDLGYSTRDNLTSVIDQQNFCNNETFTYSLREMLATANGDYGQKQYTYDPARNRTALISTPSGGSAATDMLCRTRGGMLIRGETSILIQEIKHYVI